MVVLVEQGIIAEHKATGVQRAMTEQEHGDQEAMAEQEHQ